MQFDSKSGGFACISCTQLHQVPEAGPSGTTHEIHAPEPLPVLSPPQHCPVPDPLAVALADLAVIPVPSSDGMDHMRLYIMNLVSGFSRRLSVINTD